MSIRVMTEVWKLSPHKGSALLLLLAIADFADDDGKAFPAVASLAKKLRMSQRNTRYIIKILEGSGALEVRRNAGPRGCNLFRVQPLHDEPGSREGVQPVAATPAIAIAAEPSVTINEPSMGETRCADLPNWISRETWASYVELRKKKRAPLTKRAIVLIVDKLKRWREQGQNPNEVLEQSVMNGWTGVFELKRAKGAIAAPSPKEWWETSTGIERKGAELGMQRGDEAFPHYKAHVFAGAGDGPWNQREREIATAQLALQRAGA